MIKNAFQGESIVPSTRNSAEKTPKKGRCVVPGCNNPQHAKGYCNTHYGQMWRKGKIISEKKSKKRLGRPSAKTKNKKRKDKRERLETLEREYNRAKNMYEIVIGFEGRMKWRKEMEAVRREIEKLNNEPDEIIMDPEPIANPKKTKK